MDTCDTEGARNDIQPLDTKHFIGMVQAVYSCGGYDMDFQDGHTPVTTIDNNWIHPLQLCWQL